MSTYSQEDLEAALLAISSIIEESKEAQNKFQKVSSHYTLIKNRLNAMYISKSLIAEKFSNIKKVSAKINSADTNNPNILISNLDKVHTTDLGAERIKNNLQLTTDDVVSWCKEKISDSKSEIRREGKNWYVINDGCEITVNAYSYTIITGHKVR